MLDWGFSPDPWDWLSFWLSLIVPVTVICLVFLNMYPHYLIVDFALDEWVYVLLILAVVSAVSNIIHGIEWDRWPPPWMKYQMNTLGSVTRDPLAYWRDVLAPGPDGPLPDFKFDYGACEGQSCMAVK